MKQLLLCLALILVPTPALAGSSCEIIPPEVAAEGIADFACDPATGEWHRLADIATPIATLAQVDPGTPTAAPPASATTPEVTGTSQAPTGADTATPTSPNVGELVSDAGKVIDDWQNLGWLAGVIALINLLLGLLRVTPINDWLTEIDYKWIKPLIATLLGAALGGFSTFQTGAGVLNSIVAGAIAGLGSVGFHQLLEQTRKRTSKPPAIGGI